MSWSNRSITIEEMHSICPNLSCPIVSPPPTRWKRFCGGADIVLTVVPSHHCRAVYQSMLPLLRPEMVLVSATKGIETESLLAYVGSHQCGNRTCLSGQSCRHLRPVVCKERLPRGTRPPLSSPARISGSAQLIQQEFSSPSLRLYTNTDVTGVELGGAVKNVIAIAAGVCSGLGFGFNSLAALVTRGLSEMTRLAVACGGKRDTLGGLAGMGDLSADLHRRTQPQSIRRSAVGAGPQAR